MCTFKQRARFCAAALRRKRVLSEPDTGGVGSDKAMTENDTAFAFHKEQ